MGGGLLTASLNLLTMITEVAGQIKSDLVKHSYMILDSEVVYVHFNCIYPAEQRLCVHTCTHTSSAEVYQLPRFHKEKL